MIVTSLLVRWMQGWHEVADTAGIGRWGRKEATLGLGASEALSEVTTVAMKQLAYFADPRTEIACDTFPRDEHETPIAGYVTGDTVVVPDRTGRPPNRQRVQAITATMDEDGVVTYATELGDVLLEERERFAEALTKMANGTLGGEAKVAQPIAMATEPTKDCCVPQMPGGG